MKPNPFLPHNSLINRLARLPKAAFKRIHKGIAQREAVASAELAKKGKP